MAHFPPYLIEEAEFALYLADSAGAPAGEQWMGGCLEGLSARLTFEKQRLDPHGDPFGSVRHVDEEHVITIKNLWCIQRGTNETPRLARNQKFILVVLWADQGAGTWIKRSYFGVTCDGQELAETNRIFYQDVTLNARRLTEISGVATLPDLQPTLAGTIFYCVGNSRLPLYTYDFESGALAAIQPALLLGRASIVQAGEGWSFVFGAGPVPVLTVDASGVTGGVLTAVGSSFARGTPSPRLEFWTGARRLASLTAAGELAVGNVNESDDPPAGEFFRFASRGDGYLLVGGSAWFNSYTEQ